jgi:hypothetical protein
MLICRKAPVAAAADTAIGRPDRRLTMWMAIARPLVVLLGVAALGAAAGVSSVISLNPAGGDALMYWVLIMMAWQGVIGVGLIIYGAWLPLRRWMRGER